MTTRFALRAATEDLHRKLDQRLSCLALGDGLDYRRFLHFQARALPSIEGALARAGISDVVPGWLEGRRSALLEADLRTLGETMPQAASAPPIEGIAQLLGTAYVSEGSRLGGQVLRRHVADGFPTRFLSGDGSLGPWPALIAAIESFLSSEPLIEEAKDAARRCFAWFLNIAHEAGI